MKSFVRPGLPFAAAGLLRWVGVVAIAGCIACGADGGGGQTGKTAPSKQDGGASPRDGAADSAMDASRVSTSSDAATRSDAGDAGTLSGEGDAAISSDAGDAGPTLPERFHGCYLCDDTTDCNAVCGDMGGVCKGRDCGRCADTGCCVCQYEGPMGTTAECKADTCAKGMTCISNALVPIGVATLACGSGSCAISSQTCTPDTYNCCLDETRVHGDEVFGYCKASACPPVPDAGNGDMDASVCSADPVSTSVAETISTIYGSVLVVFDRSGSMSSDWDGAPRWQRAGSAVIGALKLHAEARTVGMLFFPDYNVLNPMASMCQVKPLSDAAQIAFMPGDEALAKMQEPTPDFLSEPRYSATFSGQTPLLQALQEASTALAASSHQEPTGVIVVTDGEPNCSWDTTAATTAVTDWTTGTDRLTWSVLLPSVSAEGKTALDAVASAGGTVASITATDATDLAAQLRQLVGILTRVTVSTCTFELAVASPEPSELHLLIDYRGLEYDVARSYTSPTVQPWSLDADGKTVTLTGALCDNAKAGYYDGLHFAQGCVTAPVMKNPENGFPN